jgi:UDP-2,3-diacylglucosamine pyrophosphatase LpxH
MCSVQFASDLHLEFYESKDYKFEDFIVSKADILLLLGDIGNPKIETYKMFIHDCSLRFKHVLVISGNHEYYSNEDNNTTMSDTDDLIINICNQHKNVTYLNNGKFTIKHDNKQIIFLGSALWSLITKAEREIVKQVSNDLRSINDGDKLITVEKINEIHKRNVDWLTASLEEIKNANENNTIVVILTHHLPSYKAISPKYRLDKYNSMYASNLDHIIKKYKPQYWLFGHTHTRININIHDTKLYCNPRGYVLYDDEVENSKYNKEELLVLL